MHLKISNFQRTQRSSGISVIELVIATAIASIVFAALATFSIYTARSFVAVGNYSDLDRTSRNALDVMTRDIRESRAITSYATNKIVLTANDGVTSLTYNYDKNASTLTRTKGTSSTVLLTSCDYLKFNISQRNVSNNFTFYPVTSNLLSTAKLVDVSWKCSRKILGKKLNTESVQTAKIVIRN